MQLPEEKAFCAESTLSFRLSAPLPKPPIHKYPKAAKENYKPIELRAQERKAARNG